MNLSFVLWLAVEGVVPNNGGDLFQLRFTNKADLTSNNHTSEVNTPLTLLKTGPYTTSFGSVGSSAYIFGDKDGIQTHMVGRSPEKSMVCIYLITCFL